MDDNKNDILHEINRLFYQAQAAGIPVRFAPMYGSTWDYCILFGGGIHYDKKERGLVWKEEQDDKET